MDMIDNMRAVVAVASHGSFATAARALDISPSVLTKRVAQLESALGFKLFYRTTRRVHTTSAGEFHLSRMIDAVNAHDVALEVMLKPVNYLEGVLRVKLPVTQGFLQLGSLVREFAQENPSLQVLVHLADGAINPATHGYDIALTAFPLSFDGVSDVFLWPIARSIVAAPSYIERRGAPDHPRQLQVHDCLVYQPVGNTWPFISESDVVSVDVTPRFSSNDMLSLRSAAVNGMGVAILSRHVLADLPTQDTLVGVLPSFSVPNLWMKAMIPQNRATSPQVDALIDFLRRNTTAITTPAD